MSENISKKSKEIFDKASGKTKKRRCKNCGQVHIHTPFVDCYSEKDDGPLPDSLEDYYKRKFGDE